MLLSFLSAYRQRKVIKQYQQLLKAAQKVLAYRQDILSSEALASIIQAQTSLQASISDWKPHQSLEAANRAAELLDKQLKQHGGKIYPMGFWGENVEMIVVAAILAIGFRSFFFQPFKIPTNSMYPSYYGMTDVVYTDEKPEPSRWAKLKNYLLLGSETHRVLAPATGELVVPIFGPESERPGGLLAFKIDKIPAYFGLIQEPGRIYTFFVQGKPVDLPLPADYSLDDVFLKRYFPNQDIADVLSAAFKQGRIKPGRNGQYLWFTGINVSNHQSILNFDILTGDRLFVDRFTYNFRLPAVGDAIVFYTRKIKGLAAADGTPDDRFYIKRLVGLPGDTLEVKPPVLYRNGQPITGSKAFDFNAQQIREYPGYVPAWHLKAHIPLKVPQTGYYAMGDNSPYSLDSRNWGTVPVEEVMGRAIFIYYPFTQRWGISD